ncbi:MAG TPA: VTT domain-containing protein [Dehalococcoidia bacterium]|nr:VTT domain-containing protein [Dehalococcoidia bacterium]
MTSRPHDVMERAEGAKDTAGLARRRLLRLEYLLLVAIALVVTAFTAAFFYFGGDGDELRRYGYAGLFLVNLLGSASIFMPSPAAASVVGGGAFLHDFLGVPAFFWVGLVAGLGEALGEVTGYLAGYGGRVVVEDHPHYRRLRGWMERNGTATMFLLAVVPNPLFDMGGLVAGAVTMPLPRFFLAVLAGKVIKDWYMAGFGGLGGALLGRLA